MVAEARKTLTFITRKAPYGRNHAKACLDMVLSAAVFDQQVNYLFMDDGVYQLLKDQAPAGIHARNLSAAFPALELYGVEQVYVDADSLQARGLTRDSLLSKVRITLCDMSAVQTLIRHSDSVFNL